MQINKAFTLIELLVVVLVIGILAAVALPQYQRAVEKARLTEAVTNLRVIANAHQLYYLANGEYLRTEDMDKLDITIPGTVVGSQNRVTTVYFKYSPNGDGPSHEKPYANFLALAIQINKEDGKEAYSLKITQTSPTIIRCEPFSAATVIQQKLCAELNAKGTL